MRRHLSVYVIPLLTSKTSILLLVCQAEGSASQGTYKLSRAVCAQVEHAVADGYDVLGLMYWTLMDNFEVRRPAI